MDDAIRILESTLSWISAERSTAVPEATELMALCDSPTQPAGLEPDIGPSMAWVAEALKTALPTGYSRQGNRFV